MSQGCGNMLQTFVGNGKKIDLSINSGVLRVTGNNCFVSVTRNDGQIIITGNSGHLQVSENAGCIGYTGNYGLIEVGTTLKGVGRVVYTGNGGTVKRMKTNGVSGNCGVERSSTKNPLPSKQDGQEAKQIGVQSEFRVNEGEVCINSKSKKNIHEGVTKENISPDKSKRTPMASVGSGYAVRKVWRQESCKSDKQKKPSIKSSCPKIIQMVNLPNLELEKWCLSLATELVALYD